MKRLIVIGVVVVLVVVGAVVVVSQLRHPAPVTDKAGAATVALFDRLSAVRGSGILFGQQLVLDEHISDEPDTLATVGAYPAVFGWDTQAIDGREPPGSLDALVDGMLQADALGGVNELSTHMNNLVTGGDYHDVHGQVVQSVLADPAKLDAQLDQIAEIAERIAPVPLIVRPFHEQNGDWFWWGTTETSTDDYVALYRYTVTYLQNAGATNLLYAWSPNGTFGGDESAYLATYPGDDYVDIVGYDSYESDNSADDSSAWISAVVADLAMVSRVADSHGKIPAFTEFGRNGDRTIRDSGNRSRSFYTELLDALRSDPDARRIAYMLTWANWDTGQLYVPYPGHEMESDFQKFYDDGYTVFATTPE